MLLFAGSTALTIATTAMMGTMGELPMPGGWTLSMIWTRMPGHGWPGTAASFTGMWTAMMVAMMLPSLSPMLWRHRKSVDRITALIALGYFFVWTLLGLAVFALGASLATVEMQVTSVARAVPIATGAAIVIAGAIQFTRWKACHLACCRDLLRCGRTPPTDAATAWRYGLRFGLHCTYCCASLMAILLVAGVMDPGAMAGVTAAITAERLAPQGAGVARAVGVVVVASGVLLLARASGLV